MKLCGDRTVGRLIKWLRILGLPCERKEFVSSEDIPQGTLLLTRKRTLKGERVFFIPHDRLEEQLRFFLEKNPSFRGKIRPFSLCLRCNQPLERAAPEEVFGLVPDFVYETYRDFKRCPQCGRIYWRGSHPQRMLARLEEVLNGLDKPGGRF